MAYKDLREYIDALEENGLLRRITEEVDPILEISEISSRVISKGGPALLFENVKGYKTPVLTNAFGSFKHINLALEVDSAEDVAKRIRELANSEVPDTFIKKVRSLPKLRTLRSSIPKNVKTGPCKEVIIKEGCNVLDFPIIKCWPEDGGRFITLPMVFTKDPKTGIRNAGMYRIQVYDGQRLGMHWHIHKHGAKHYADSEKLGKPLHAAVVIGTDPVTTYASSAPLPDDLDEMLFAGFIRKKPVAMVKCETVDLEVPASAEIVIEGIVKPQERVMEGPFGDHTGYYSLPEEYPVLHVTCITHRKNPIYLTTVTGRPPREDFFIGKTTQKIFMPMIQKILPEISSFELPEVGGFHNLAFVGIKKRFAGHAFKVASALWGLGQMSITKIIVVFDDDVNIKSLNDAIFTMCNNIDPERDVNFIKGPVDTLDHSSREPAYGSKMVIDATKKWPEEGFHREWPEKIRMSEEIIDLVNGKWDKYGIYT